MSGSENYFHDLRNIWEVKHNIGQDIFIAHIFNLESQPALLKLHIMDRNLISFASIIKTFKSELFVQ